jgi:Ras-related GTP-binding protein C/D
MEKVFLFEVVSKLYIATDSSPVDITNFAICSEMIDVFIDVSYIYGQTKNHANYYDQKSQATIKLNDLTILHLKEVEQFNTVYLGIWP